jgi:hypothetical protein
MPVVPIPHREHLGDLALNRREGCLQLPHDVADFLEAARTRPDVWRAPGAVSTWFWACWLTQALALPQLSLICGVK